MCNSQPTGQQNNSEYIIISNVLWNNNNNNRSVYYLYSQYILLLKSNQNTACLSLVAGFLTIQSVQTTTVQSSCVFPPCRSVKEASSSWVRQGAHGCPGAVCSLWRSGASWCFSSSSISSSTRVSCRTALWVGGRRLGRGRRSGMGKRSLRTAWGERRVKEEHSSLLWVWQGRKRDISGTWIFRTGASLQKIS